MPRATRKSRDRKQANQKQQARDRQAAGLERKFHAEWQIRQAVVDEADGEQQPEIDTANDNGGDEQP